MLSLEQITRICYWMLCQLIFDLDKVIKIKSNVHWLILNKIQLTLSDCDTRNCSFPLPWELNVSLEMSSLKLEKERKVLEDLNAKILHHADSENAAIPHFEIKITEIPQEKLSNTANAWKRLHKHQCPPSMWLSFDKRDNFKGFNN